MSKTKTNAEMDAVNEQQKARIEQEVKEKEAVSQKSAEEKERDAQRAEEVKKAKERQEVIRKKKAEEDKIREEVLRKERLRQEARKAEEEKRKKEEAEKMASRFTTEQATEYLVSSFIMDSTRVKMLTSDYARKLVADTHTEINIAFNTENTECYKGYQLYTKYMDSLNPQLALKLLCENFLLDMRKSLGMLVMSNIAGCYVHEIHDTFPYTNEQKNVIKIHDNFALETFEMGGMHTEQAKRRQGTRFLFQTKILDGDKRDGVNLFAVLKDFENEVAFVRKDFISKFCGKFDIDLTYNVLELLKISPKLLTVSNKGFWRFYEDPIDMCYSFCEGDPAYSHLNDIFFREVPFLKKLKEMFPEAGFDTRFCDFMVRFRSETERSDSFPAKRNGAVQKLLNNNSILLEFKGK